MITTAVSTPRSRPARSPFGVAFTDFEKAAPRAPATQLPGDLSTSSSCPTSAGWCKERMDAFGSGLQDAVAAFGERVAAGEPARLHRRRRGGPRHEGGREGDQAEGAAAAGADPQQGSRRAGGDAALLRWRRHRPPRRRPIFEHLQLRQVSANRPSPRRVHAWPAAAARRACCGDKSASLVVLVGLVAAAIYFDAFRPPRRDGGAIASRGDRARHRRRRRHPAHLCDRSAAALKSDEGGGPAPRNRRRPITAVKCPSTTRASSVGTSFSRRQASIGIKRSTSQRGPRWREPVAVARRAARRQLQLP